MAKKSKLVGGEMVDLTLNLAIARINEIVKILNSEDVDLNHSVEIYEEATGLLKWCNNSVEKAKLKVEQVNTENGFSSKE